MKERTSEEERAEGDGERESAMSGFIGMALKLSQKQKIRQRFFIFHCFADLADSLRGTRF